MVEHEEWVYKDGTIFLVEAIGDEEAYFQLCEFLYPAGPEDYEAQEIEKRRGKLMALAPQLFMALKELVEAVEGGIYLEPGVVN